jgi:hypothetical protein
MKIKFLLLASILYLTACKKTYTCECNTTYTFRNNGGGLHTITVPGNSEPYSEKMKEKQAKTACEHEEVAIQTDFSNAVTNNSGQMQPGESIKTSCGLK